jgi:histone H3/H4/uncharacterized integral membrane protein
MNFQPSLKESLNALTEEFFAASIRKAEELNYDQNRGDISLSETYYNLAEIRDQLSDAIEKEKLSQLPLSMQRRYLIGLQNITAKINGLIGGADEIVNIANDVESLYVDLYHARLDKFTDEYLGYASKLNQLKHLITEAKALKKEVQGGVEQKSVLETLVQKIQKSSIEIQNLANTAAANVQTVNSEMQKVSEASQQIATVTSTVTASEKMVKDLLAEVRASDTAVKTIQKESEQFSADIAGFRDTIQNVQKNARDTIDENAKNTLNLVEELRKVENQIKDQIQKATGFSLFHSFQTRQVAIGKNKNKWLIAIGSMIAAALLITLWIANNHKGYDVAFYLKISLSLPLIFGISFCTVQYSRERKLEEEYAFKSNISISLIPYKDLIEQLSITPEQKERYTAFLIDSISRVFTSPTETVFGGNNGSSNQEDAIKNLSKAMDSLMKPIEPVLRALNKK